MTIRSNHEWYYTTTHPYMAFCRHCGIRVESVAAMRNADKNLVCEHTTVADRWNRLIASFWLPTIPAIGQDSAMEVADDYQS